MNRADNTATRRSPPRSGLVIAIVTPAPPRARNGNRVTALRWAKLLRELGHSVVVRQEWSEQERSEKKSSNRPADLLFALHAAKSAGSVAAFKRRWPERPVVVLLAGTDFLGDEKARRAADGALAQADRIAVLQHQAVELVPAALRAKVRVLRQSARATPTPRATTAARPTIHFEADAFPVAVLAHLRDVKDPLAAARAARQVPAASKLLVAHAGAALTPEFEATARREMEANPRYRWLGELPHGRALELLAGSRLLVISSRTEGGANVASEAIACGVPVLASAIDGSTGILGGDYPGLFPAGDDAALARLLWRCESEPTFLATLVEWCRKLAPLVAPEAERAALAQLLEELVPAATATNPANARLRTIALAQELPFTRMASCVAYGLAQTPKFLECCWFYDDEGSRLFEQICALPEYYVTRAEDAILADHAGAMVAAALPPNSSAESPATLIELGSGSSTKTRRLIRALLKRQPRLRYVMIDISASALAESAAALLADHPRLDVVSICADYAEGAARLRELSSGPRLVIWLGSNVGNFERADAAEFLAGVAAQLEPRDRFLLGVDLRKSARVLVPAYDDAAGVTARFNQNVLARVNREFGGDFDLAAFRHRATYDETTGRVEMWLVSTRAQTVRLRLLDRTFTFAAGEVIHTEDSFKYSPAEIEALARGGGFTLVQSWLDGERRFTDVLLAPQSRSR